MPCTAAGRALRVPRARSKRQAWAHVTPEVMISERPAEADDRAVPGHWEGDPLIGLERSAIGTLVERTTRFTVLGLPTTRRRVRCHPTDEKRAAGRLRRSRDEECARHHDRDAARATAPVADLDRGKELSAHAPFKVETGIPIYFADPHSPRQSDTNEKHQWPVAAVLPQGHRRLAMERPRISKPSPPRSTTGGTRRSVGRHQPKPSASSYCL